FKDAKDALVMLRVDADALIFHPDPNAPIAALGADADARSFTGADKLQGIAEHLDQDFMENFSVGADGGQWAIDLHDRGFALDLIGGLAEGGGDDFFQIELGNEQFGAANAPVIEQVSKQFVHAAAGFGNALGVILAAVIEILDILLQQHSGEALHGAQGSAEI